MAESRLLSGDQIVRLSESIPSRNVEKIALQYFGLSNATINNIKTDYPGAEAFSREIITRWSYRNPNNQVKVLAQLLYKAAENGDVNPSVVKEILNISRSEAGDAPGDSESSSSPRERVRSTDKEPTDSLPRKRLTSENVRDLAQQTVSIGNISQMGTLEVDVKERIIEATLMGDAEKTAREAIQALSEQSMDMLDAVVQKIKESARPRKSSKRMELTSKMKRALSKNVTNLTKLRDLGINGFGVDDQQIDAPISSNNNIFPEAAYVVISDWSDEYEDPADAFEDLEMILKGIGKGAWIAKIKDVKE